VTRRRVGVLISGRGSNFSALAAAADSADFPAGIVAVLSNDPSAAGLARAKDAGIPAIGIDHRKFGRNREAHERAMQSVLETHGVELLCLAGYMRLLTPFLVGAWQRRMLNIHPSLLPAFPGLHTHERALAAGAKIHGCTVHLVTETMDEGPILGQAAVPVLPGDTAESLAARVLAQEHRLYPAVLKAFLDGAGSAPGAGAYLINPLPGPAAAP
jgi:formyltetrahydrofolate-dependent phosphoribosylglycinamide formyltransferase